MQIFPFNHISALSYLEIIGVIRIYVIAALKQNEYNTNFCPGFFFHGIKICLEKDHVQI